MLSQYMNEPRCPVCLHIMYAHVELKNTYYCRECEQYCNDYNNNPIMIEENDYDFYKKHDDKRDRVHLQDERSRS